MTVLGSTTLITMTPEQLKEFAKECFALAMVPQKSKEELLTKKETAKLLKCSVNRVNHYVLHLRHMNGGRPMWFRSEIEEYLKKQ